MCDTHVPFNQAVIYRQKIRQLRDTWSIGITVLKPIHRGYFDHTATLGYVSMTHTADLKESGRARSAYSISFAFRRCRSANSFGAHKELASGHLFSEWRFLCNSLRDLKL